jgi:hypothetical protein
MQYSPMVECITRSQFLNNGSSYKLQKLPPGNYSLRVRAMSLAGYGDYTEPRYFFIKVSCYVIMSSLCCYIHL